jgi:transcriptional regulator of acetoin/glycerol metabolism
VPTAGFPVADEAPALLPRDVPSSPLQTLVEQADPVMALLFRKLESPQGSVVLLDPEGRLLHAVGHLALTLPDAPGLHHPPSSRAAVVLNPDGDVAAQLDWVTEPGAPGVSAGAWVSAAARLIENRWLSVHHRKALRVHFHRLASALGGLSEGIVALSTDERVLGANRQALELLGMGRAALRRQTLKSLFGVQAEVLLEHFRAPCAAPLSLRLPDGRVVHAHARSDWPVWSTIAEAASRQHTARPTRLVAHWDEQAPGWAAWLTGDPQIERIVEQLRRLTDQGLPVILEGETGCGKEWLARSWHAESPRAEGPFVTVSCALRPVALLEAELFGSAVAGADGKLAPGTASVPGAPSVPGKLLQSDGGMLLLDDIDELPAVLQARLCQFLRTRQLPAAPFGPLVSLDVAIVAASRHPLGPLAPGTATVLPMPRALLREDLYHELNGWTVRLPALRERRDFEALVRRILDSSLHAPHVSLSDEVMRYLKGYRWPGNLRQLVQVLRAGAVQAGTQRWMRLEHLPPVFRDELGDYLPPVVEVAEPPAHPPEQPASAQDLDAIERAAILQALEQAGGNVSLAARRLGVSRNTVYRRLRHPEPGSSSASP